MKSWEMEEWIKQQAYKEGHDEGYSVGHDEGRREGRSEGYSEGRSEGHSEGSALMQERINQLILKLIDTGRTDDIVKAAKNKEFQEELFKEFDI